MIPDGKTIAGNISIALHDRDKAVEQGVDAVKSGSCEAVRRASTLVYQAAHTLYVEHETEIQGLLGAITRCVSSDVPRNSFS